MADEPDNETPETETPAAPDTGRERRRDGAPSCERSEGGARRAASPKERRRKARSTHSGGARKPRSAEERHAERVEERKRKATRRRARRLQERAKKTAQRGSATPSPTTAPAAREEGARKIRQGIVVSDKADKTITVRIDVARRHRRYEKIVRSSSTLHAHDESNEAHAGDTVRVVESRPLSRTKRWRLVDVLERAR